MNVEGEMNVYDKGLKEDTIDGKDLATMNRFYEYVNESGLHGELCLQQLGRVPHGGALHGGDFGWSTDVEIERKGLQRER